MMFACSILICPVWMVWKQPGIIEEKKPATKIIMLTTYNDKEIIAELGAYRSVRLSIKKFGKQE